MVHTMDPPSSAPDVSGDSPSGEIPESSHAVATGDLPSAEIQEASEANAAEYVPAGEMSEAKEEAEELEDLPSGKSTLPLKKIYLVNRAIWNNDLVWQPRQWQSF